MKSISQNADYVRNIIFGLEDGFVSTCGVLFGVATASTNQNYILTAGIITVLVEATSMGAGAYLSEKSSHELNHRNKTKAKPLADGVIMFIAYTTAGAICVIPYAAFPLPYSQVLSVILTLTGLFLIGYLPKRKFNRGAEILIIASIAILIGFVAGKTMQALSPA